MSDPGLQSIRSRLAFKLQVAASCSANLRSRVFCLCHNIIAQSPSVGSSRSGILLPGKAMPSRSRRYIQPVLQAFKLQDRKYLGVIKCAIGCNLNGATGDAYDSDGPHPEQWSKRVTRPDFTRKGKGSAVLISSLCSCGYWGSAGLFVYFSFLFSNVAVLVACRFPISCTLHSLVD
ncbi:hypothetical protein K474DRAFT_421173 [Panus rudis PR-1116 ss-1]|nr:hypothetical protein K474DRAFT_421173 [Panus rudis PR-1116 ss-1]